MARQGSTEESAIRAWAGRGPAKARTLLQSNKDIFRSTLTVARSCGALKSSPKLERDLLSFIKRGYLLRPRALNQRWSWLEYATAFYCEQSQQPQIIREFDGERYRLVIRWFGGQDAFRKAQERGLSKHKDSVRVRKLSSPPGVKASIESKELRTKELSRRQFYRLLEELSSLVHPQWDDAGIKDVCDQ